MDYSSSKKSWMKNPHIQTAWGSSKLRVLGKNPMLDRTRELIIDAGNGIRLLGCHSVQPANPSNGLTLLIHGWEGSCDSAYILSTGKYLFNKGYDIFRLNLRDHGNSHHLNEGLFHGALIEETSRAIQNIAALACGKPFYIVGFSLGGNFALRIALRQTADSPIANLRHTVCISPPLDPYKATLAIDNGLPIYRYYFLRKWKRSLKKKQSLFPGKYDFKAIIRMRTCLEMTEAIMPYYPDYRDYRDYFNKYTLEDSQFKNLSTPVTVVIAEDDPVICAADYNKLSENDYLNILILKHGGHNGFFDSSPFDCWYEKKIEKIFLSADTIEK